MANLTSNQSLYRFLRKQIEEQIVTEDDQLIFDAFLKNDIQHACQPIRDIFDDDIEYQHLTIRYGSEDENNVYKYDLSEEFSYCLDLFSLIIALRQAQFQTETFHPDLINSVVLPIRAEALLWGPGKPCWNRWRVSTRRSFACHPVTATGLFHGFKRRCGNAGSAHPG